MSEIIRDRRIRLAKDPLIINSIGTITITSDRMMLSNVLRRDAPNDIVL
jgi:hypothetical protein